MANKKKQQPQQVPRDVKRAGARAATSSVATAEDSDVPFELSLSAVPPQWIVAGAGMIFMLLWAYWPTLLEMVHRWDEPDYSHGFLVLPLALYALYVRADTFPRGQVRWCWIGLVVIGASILIRFVGGLFFLGGVDGWSMLVWITGVALLFGGWRFLWWCFPAIAFLWFMVPLPYHAEISFRLPLQRVATKLSCWILQSMGQPALGEANTILLGENHLEVEEACAGMRIFIAIAVMAFAYVMIVRPAWWERVILIACIAPIALITNAVRIVTTGMLYQFWSGEAARRFSHDFAGWMMIPLAAALFGLVLWYLGKLIKPVHVSDMRQMFRQEPA